MIDQELLDNLSDLLLSIDKKEDMIDLLYGILTPTELEEITRRLEIIKLLKKGIPQQQIASKLGIGIATVTRGSRELKLGRFKAVKV